MRSHPTTEKKKKRYLLRVNSLPTTDKKRHLLYETDDPRSSTHKEGGGPVFSTLGERVLVVPGKNLRSLFF